MEFQRVGQRRPPQADADGGKHPETWGHLCGTKPAGPAGAGLPGRPTWRRRLPSSHTAPGGCCGLATATTSTHGRATDPRSPSRPRRASQIPGEQWPGRGGAGRDGAGRGVGVRCKGTSAEGGRCGLSEAGQAAPFWVARSSARGRGGGVARRTRPRPSRSHTRGRGGGVANRAGPRPSLEATPPPLEVPSPLIDPAGSVALGRPQQRALEKGRG